MAEASQSVKPKTSPKSIKFLFGGLAGYVKDKVLLTLVNVAYKEGGGVTYFQKNCCFFCFFFYIIIFCYVLQDF